MRCILNMRIGLIFLALLFITPQFAASQNVKSVISDTSSTFIFFYSQPSQYSNIEDYEWENDEDSLTIPLRRVYRIFMVEAEVDGEKGYLVFDTGASSVVLNKTYFRNHVVIDNKNSNGVTGAVSGVDRVSIDNLSMFGIQYKGVMADVVNLGHIENRRGVKILGLFGFSLIKNFEIVFDPTQNQLQLFKIDKKGERLNSNSRKFVSDFKTTIEFKNNILFLKNTLNGKTLRFCFDTGAETNVIDRYAPKSVLNSINITRRSTLNGAGSGTSEVLFGMMNNFSFGGKVLNNMETIITNLDPLNQAYDTKIDGMLGYSFLSKGIICINFVKKEFAINYSKTVEE